MFNCIIWNLQQNKNGKWFLEIAIIIVIHLHTRSKYLVIDNSGGSRKYRTCIWLYLSLELYSLNNWFIRSFTYLYWSSMVLRLRHSRATLVSIVLRSLAFKHPKRTSVKATRDPTVQNECAKTRKEVTHWEKKQSTGHGLLLEPPSFLKQRYL